MLHTQLNRGALIRLRRGVYLAASAMPDQPALRHLVAARAEVVANPGAVISHQSAAIAWGLPHPGFEQWHDRPVSVILPRGRSAVSRPGLGEHHVRQLDSSAITRDPEGYPVTTLARTATDLAAGRDLPGSLVILDAAARSLCAGFVASPRRRDYTNPQLITAAREPLATSAAGNPAGLADAIELAEPGRESPAESMSAGHFILAGLPRPIIQAPIRTPGGIVYPDFLWPLERVIGECDGAEKYSDARASLLEKEREQMLRDLGFRVVRWLAKEIMTRPDLVVARVARELAA
jgi:hypothetical protein